MKVQAISRNVKISPRKVRLVADSVRNLPLQEALNLLHILRKRAAIVIAKTMESAVANATNNAKLDKNNLQIANIEVADGQAIKRFHPSTRGRIHPYKKRSSHITVVLEDVKVTEVKKADEKVEERKEVMENKNEKIKNKKDK